MDDDLTADIAHQEDTNSIITNSNHMKRLSLIDCPISGDKELLHTKDSYTELDTLTVEKIIGNSWLITTINRLALASFMDFIQKRVYSVTFTGVSGESWLLKLFYDCVLE